MDGSDRGTLFVISAPSGTGKSTLARRLLESVPGLRFSVSYTTRPRRAGEENGREYEFVDDARFDAMVAAGGFLEWAHVFGRKRYDTGDDSRNSFLLSLVTMGEGWHNNHHQHMGTVRQGFYWWELDLTYYLLRLMSWTGLIWELRAVPKEAYNPTKQLRGQAAPAVEATTDSSTTNRSRIPHPFLENS